MWSIEKMSQMAMWMGEGDTSLQKSNPQKGLNKSLSINKSNNIKSNKGCVGRGSKREK